MRQRLKLPWPGTSCKVLATLPPFQAKSSSMREESEMEVSGLERSFERGGPCPSEAKQRLQDSLLTRFVDETAAEAALARDFLQGNGWDMERALASYHSLYATSTANGAVDSVVTVRDHRAEEDDDPVSSDSGPPRADSGGTTENSRVMTNARAHVQKGLTGWSLETPSYTFTLPDLAAFSDNFRRFLEKDLIETSTLKALENSGHLNWWVPGAGTRKLWPLATSGDGNCLLHSASLGMWGFHDRFLILRKALHEILARGSRRHALWRRWRWQQHAVNRESGLEYSEAEWRAEWEALVRLASPQPRSKPASAEPLSIPNAAPPDPDEEDADRVWESLEEIHVFALAHVLKRPVLVVADTVLRDSGGEAFAPIPFGGIYLPLECPPAECHRSPLVLSYDAAHFSALVLMQERQPDPTVPPAVVPITTDKPRRLLPLHFAADPGPDFTWWADAADERIARNAQLSEAQQLTLVTRYLDILKLPARRSSAFRDFGRASPAAPASPTHRPSPSPRKDRRLSLNRLASSLRNKIIRSKDPPPPKENHQPKRRFSLRSASAKKPSDEERGRSLARPGLGVSVVDLRDSAWIVGARLNTQAHHQYMTEMVDNYLKAARVRFDQEQKTLAGLGAGGGRLAPRSRERISRSLSAATFAAGLSCINGPCSQPASQATNFLCPSCFASQRQLMASFSGGAPNHPPASEPAPTPALIPKSATADTAIGVRAVTAPATGVTRYFPASSASPTLHCRSPHCRHYSNGAPALCPGCTLPPKPVP